MDETSNAKNIIASGPVDHQLRAARLHEPFREACATSRIIKMKDENVIKLTFNAAVGRKIASAPLSDTDIALYRNWNIAGFP